MTAAFVDHTVTDGTQQGSGVEVDVFGQTGGDSVAVTRRDMEHSGILCLFGR
ncbi:hypothetical protein [Streptomyces sp. cmx-4-7]|uniref:hypothetical protein n=1 Tax=Streptomyces sp. cmx-4-7 TaxID=2790939 RepID=UPI00397EC19C